MIGTAGGNNREKEKNGKSVSAVFFFWEKGGNTQKRVFYRMCWIFCEGEATHPRQVINFLHNISISPSC